MVYSMLIMFSYAAAIVCLSAILWRAVKIASLPIHLRWELYPVAHEKGRSSYGGSYLEESDWWAKPRESSFIGELKVMIPEILLLAGVWEHNRSHWFRSFPFHIGLYILVGLVGLLLIGGIAIAIGFPLSVDAGLVGTLLYHLTYVAGYAGLVLGLLGTAALLIRRLFNQDYREYTKKSDYFNLVFFLLALGVALLAHLVADPDFAALRGYFARLVTLGLAPAEVAPLSALSVAEIVLASMLVAYVPLTHMSHFFTKWFTYHDIRWNDEPNLAGGKIEHRVGNMLKYTPTWSASHISGDGKKTWVDVTTSNVEEDEE